MVTFESSVAVGLTQSWTNRSCLFPRITRRNPCSVTQSDGYPQLRGAPEGHVFNVRDVYLNAGAGFMVVLSGEIMTMPGLPKIPASDNIDIDADGNIVGLA